MRQKIVAGNWKMNLSEQEAKALVSELTREDRNSEVRMILFPPAIYLSRLVAEFADFEFGTQNFHFAQEGAYTGEVAISQYKSVGCHIGLIGHSERRTNCGETNEVIKAKVDAAIQNDFDFIFCCGEPIETRQSGKELSFVRQQFEDSLFHLSKDQIKGRIVAYEPIWAIGTGLTATTEQAEEMHAAIRSWFSEKYSDEIADSVSILYGGSCKPSNASELFSCANVDGGLIGGASLEANSFAQIINSF